MLENEYLRACSKHLIKKETNYSTKDIKPTAELSWQCIYFFSHFPVCLYEKTKEKTTIPANTWSIRLNVQHRSKPQRKHIIFAMVIWFGVIQFNFQYDNVMWCGCVRSKMKLP